MTPDSPYAALLGLTEEDGDDGAPVLVMPFEEDVLGRPGFLHGGAVAGLLEAAGFLAVGRALEGRGTASLHGITVEFARGGRSNPTRALGIVERLGTRVAGVRAVAWQEDRARPIATAQLTFLLRRTPHVSFTQITY